MVSDRFRDKAKALFGLSPEVGKFFRTTITCSVLFEIIKIIPPIIFAYLIDLMVAYDPNLSSIKLISYMLIGYVGSLMFHILVDNTGRVYIIGKINDSEVDIIRRAFNKLLQLDVTYHETHNTGFTISKIVKGSHKVNDLMWNSAYGVIPVILQTLITFFMLVYVRWEISIFFILVFPVFVFTMLKASQRTQKSRRLYHYYYDKFVGTINQSITNIRTVKDFSNEKKEIRKASAWLKKYRATMFIRTKHGHQAQALQDTVINISRGIMLALAVWFMSNGKLTAGSLVLIVTLSEKALINLNRLSQIYYRIQDAEPSVERFHDIKEEPIILKDKPNSKHEITKGHVEFKKTHFHYGKLAAIHNINVEIKPKSVIALVGRSGAGKTTLVKLLLRHFDATKGEVLIDGKNIQDYSLKNLHKGISVVSQDVELFNETIKNNIAYGAEKASLAQVKKAAKMAHAHDFIMEFENGYDTVVGERGVRLSGGQKQRIAIARAILAKPKILIFDEATASLDAESEKFIHKSIFTLIGKATLIMIAHRFSTIEHAGKIVLLERGKIAEVGTHKELLKHKGIFAKLRKLQQLGELTQ
ncbi:MAG: ABC transporter ATP-binding protein [Candidatus Nanoarchaeia archaeon]